MLPEDRRRMKPGILTRLRTDPATGRKTFLLVTGASVAVVGLATVILTILALTSSADLADRLAAAGDVLVGATLLLAAVAAVVALLAYAVSTGLPDIQLSVEFERVANNPVFVGENLEDDFIRHPAGGEVSGVIGRILLRNESAYSATNPAFVIRLRGLIFQHFIENQEQREKFEENWTVTDTRYLSSGPVGITEVQWDGGPAYSIHGHSTRRVPDLPPGSLWYFPEGGNPAITFEVLAEGYRKVITLPVGFLIEGKWRFTQKMDHPEWI